MDGGTWGRREGGWRGEGEGMYPFLSGSSTYFKGTKQLAATFGDGKLLIFFG
jgi:hypothetical protein